MERQKKEKVFVENTKFIFETNFSGDPERDNYGSTARRANIIISQELADKLSDEGFNVKATKPREGEEEGFIPKYFVKVQANYDSDWPPKIYLVPDNEAPIELDENTIGRIDKVYVTNVNCVLNPYYSQRNNTWSLYIQTMYVEFSEADDPFAARYRRPEAAN